MFNGLGNSRLKIMTISTWSCAYQSGYNQVTFIFTDNGKLCPSSVFLGPAFLTLQKMPADVMVFQAG
jgi:hypothetical protein